MKTILSHIGEDNLKKLIAKANKLQIKPEDYIQILADKGSYYLIYKDYENK